MKQRLKWEELTGIAFLAAAVFMLGVSVYLCFCNDIWYDELFTMGLGNQSLSGLVAITAADVHPPLYFIIVKLFLMAGGAVAGSVDQIVLAKLASILPFLFCMAYAVTKVRKHFGMLSAGLFSFLLLSMPKLADYTVEVRMYGYALFFITAGMLHAYEISISQRTEKPGKAEKRKSYVNWIALTLYALCACYTHYFACVAAGMIYVYLFLSGIRKKEKRQCIKALLCSGLFCVAGYLPWFLKVVTAQVGTVKENYWIQPLTWRSLFGCVKFLFCPALFGEAFNTIAAVLLSAGYGGLFFAVLLKWWKGRKRKKTEQTEQDEKEAEGCMFVFGCFLCLAGVVLFGFAASFLIRPIFVYRYMLPAMGVLWLSAAVMVSGLKKRKVFLFLVLVLLAFVGGKNYRSFYGEEMWKRVKMQETREALENIEEEDILVFNFDQAQAVVSWYLPNESCLWSGEPEKLIQKMYPQNRALRKEGADDDKEIQILQTFLEEGRTVWFFGSGKARDEIIAKWAEKGIKAEETDSVLLERYWFNIYRLKSASDIDGAEKKG